MALSFPAAILPSSVSFHIQAASRSGGMSINGSEQVAASDAGRWAASMTIELGREDAILAWRGFSASLMGRTREIEVGPFDVYTPSDINGRRVTDEVMPGVPFNSSGYGARHFHNGAVWVRDTQDGATLAADAPLRATRVTVNAAAPWMAPRPGQYFGLGARLYIATGAYRAQESDPWTIECRPPLREAASSGEKVIVDRPVCTMRLASDDSARFEMQLRRYGSISLDLVEAV